MNKEESMPTASEARGEPSRDGSIDEFVDSFPTIYSFASRPSRPSRPSRSFAIIESSLTQRTTPRIVSDNTNYVTASCSTCQQTARTIGMQFQRRPAARSELHNSLRNPSGFLLRNVGDDRCTGRCVRRRAGRRLFSDSSQSR